MRLHRPSSWLLIALLIAASAEAGPLNFYLGAGIAPVTMRLDKLPAFNGPVSVENNSHGLNAIVGLRPFEHLGFEFDHFDFGHHRNLVSTVSVDTTANAQALFAVGYLPLHLPRVDVYGKLGLARSRYSGQTVETNLMCPVTQPVCGARDFGNTLHGAALGLGVQFRFPVMPLGLRADYELFDIGGHASDMILLDAMFRF